MAGVRGACNSDGFVHRAWLVLSESAKAKGVDCMLGAVEEFLRDRLSDQHWLHGGLEVVDEVLSEIRQSPHLWRTTDIAVDRYRNCRAGKYSVVSCNTHTRAGRGRKLENKRNCSMHTISFFYCTFYSRRPRINGCTSTNRDRRETFSERRK